MLENLGSRGLVICWVVGDILVILTEDGELILGKFVVENSLN